MSNKQKELPTRRDRREAVGYLEDLLARQVEDAHGLAEFMLDAAIKVHVQRATDRLVLYFDLTEEPGALPEATTDADGVDNGGEREAGSDPLDEFAPEDTK